MNKTAKERMKHIIFDQYANLYDSWFIKNEAILESELLLLKHAIEDPGKALSIGCGTGLFEYFLKNKFDINVQHGVEPAKGMADIAQKRGLEVQIAEAEKLPFNSDAIFDTVFLNGSSSYI